MLEARQLSVAYGPHPALHDVSLTVAPGEIVVILGANGAGKSTLLRAVSGICEGHVSGDVSLDGAPLLGLTSDQIVERGVALVPEGRGIFGDLSVRENLVLGAYPRRARRDEGANLDRVLALFPKLRERQGQMARTMSGGEQQMVAIGRAMMSAPQILMLDEPSLGLSPLLCKELFQNLKAVRELGIGVLLVEQNAKQSLAIADRGYLLENTRITHEDSADRLATDPAVQKAYLGGGGKAASQSVAASVEKPADTLPPAPQRFGGATPTPRRSAAAQIGMDIDAIVKSAERRSAEAQAAPPAAAASPAPTDRLARVVQDMERAAAEARRRPAARKKAPTPAPSPAPTQTRADPAPVIEIYRRPRVQVYRRADGDFGSDTDA